MVHAGLHFRDSERESCVPGEVAAGRRPPARDGRPPYASGMPIALPPAIDHAQKSLNQKPQRDLDAAAAGRTGGTNGPRNRTRLANSGCRIAQIFNRAALGCRPLGTESQATKGRRHRPDFNRAAPACRPLGTESQATKGVRHRPDFQSSGTSLGRRTRVPMTAPQAARRSANEPCRNRYKSGGGPATSHCRTSSVIWASYSFCDCVWA